MRERTIGEVFELDGSMLEVIPDPQDEGTFRCQKCVLMATPSRRLCLYDEVREITGPCNRWKRKDGRDVQFIYAEKH